jgi:hypothetical protein
MNDNEKAATFIGWKPELEPPQPSYPNLKLYHPYRGYMPAPDMADPVNLWRLVIELLKRGHNINMAAHNWADMGKRIVKDAARYFDDENDHRTTPSSHHD